MAKANGNWQSITATSIHLFFFFLAPPLLFYPPTNFPFASLPFPSLPFSLSLSLSLTFFNPPQLLPLSLLTLYYAQANKIYTRTHSKQKTNKNKKKCLVKINQNREAKREEHHGEEEEIGCHALGRGGSKHVHHFLQRR